MKELFMTALLVIAGIGLAGIVGMVLFFIIGMGLGWDRE